jgi:hypothetical protein
VNGQDLVNEALGLLKTTLSGMETSAALNGDPLVKALAEACRDLEAIKGKPTLRTKNGTNMAFPVAEAARRLQEAWEDALNGGPDSELRQAVAELVDAGGVLKESFKGRTVIMT